MVYQGRGCRRRCPESPDVGRIDFEVRRGPDHISKRQNLGRLDPNLLQYYSSEAVADEKRRITMLPWMSLPNFVSSLLAGTHGILFPVLVQT